jgi:TolB protein
MIGNTTFRALLMIVTGWIGLAPAAFAEGLTVTRLTNVINAYPHSSPDGERVVFQSNRTGTAQIYVMNADGSDVRQLTDRERGAETPKWSPEGQTILFAAYLGENNNDLFLMDADGGNVKQLTDGPGYDGHPSWSADGSRIIFNSDRSSPDPDAPWNKRWHEIYSIRADGSDLTQHTRNQTICTYPGYAPDGERIVYRKIVEGPGLAWDLSTITRNSEVFVADVDGANEVNLTSNAAFDGWPAWSPDGRWIVFSSNRAGPANVGQLFVVSPDSGDVRKMTEGPRGYAQPSWTADSKGLLAYQFVETEEYEFGDVVWIEGIADGP